MLGGDLRAYVFYFEHVISACEQWSCGVTGFNSATGYGHGFQYFSPITNASLALSHT